MELTNTPMTDRQKKYRATYRERVAGWYNGWLHIFIIYTIGFTGLYIYGSNLHEVQWWEWLIVPVTPCWCQLLRVAASPLCDAPSVADRGTARDL